MDKKNWPRYKSSEYFAKFSVKWLEENEVIFWLQEIEMIRMFIDNGELRPESRVVLKNYSLLEEKRKRVCWTRETAEGRESVVLGEIEPNAEFLDFLNKFFRRWHGGYRETSYCVIKAICRLYQQEPDKFREIAAKAKNLNEFVEGMAI